MPYIGEFTECCGIDIVAGFERRGYGEPALTPEMVKTWTTKDEVEKLLIDQYGYFDFDTEDEPTELEKGPGLILIALNEEQYKTMDKPLKDNKFKRLSEFVNPNTGHNCRLYGRKRKQPRNRAI